VSLKICVSKKFQGEAKSLEGQAIKWLAINELDQYDFPAANRTIIKELQACYAKTIITSRELRARS
jgi:8-oxo-dGTP diphosphatase